MQRQRYCVLGDEFFKFLPEKQRQEFLEGLSGKASELKMGQDLRVCDSMLRPMKDSGSRFCVETTDRCQFCGTMTTRNSSQTVWQPLWPGLEENLITLSSTCHVRVHFPRCQHRYDICQQV